VPYAAVEETEMPAIAAALLLSRAFAGAGAPAPHDVTSGDARHQNLLEYVASRTDLSAAERRGWDQAIRNVFGGKALKDGADEGVTTAKSVISAAIFQGIEPIRGARAAYDAYHDTYRFVPPPIAITYQVLAFAGHAPAQSPRELAFNFPEHFDADIAPELTRWWDEALKSGRLPPSERAQVERALRETQRKMQAHEKPPPAPTASPAGDGVALPRGWPVPLETAVGHWIGTPYRWGGVDHRGVDCSAFVRAIYKESIGIELPRDARDQSARGRPVARSELKPGDLVFFDTLDRGRITHVAIYIGEGLIAHASSSKGVTRAELGQPYYQRAYVASRRLLRW
jgi:probable lipoprotein NlpC